jgi:alcohol dehydrogenase class IV
MAVALPLPIAGATGMDALTHAVESYTSLSTNPISEGLALHAIRLISENLRQAAASDHNHHATEQMLIASNVAGIAFSQSRLGNVHAMSHPVSGHYGTAHGVANAILLTRIMDFNRIACPDRFAEIAAAMGADVEGLDEMEAAICAVEAVEDLARDVGIPESLTEVGANADGIPVMAEDAMKSPNIQINPRKTTLEDVIALYEASI